MEELQSVVENVDNIVKKNNIRVRGLKEGAEKKGLSQYLEEVFTGCLGVDTEIVMWITAAYCIGLLRKTQKYPRYV